MTATERTSRATVHVWPWPALRGDYIRAGLGLAVTAGPLALVDEAPWATVVLGVLAVLFAWFLARTVRRHAARIEADADGIRAGRRAIAWPAVTSVTARRFGAQKRDGGYVEMTLKGGSARITVDSQLTDFLALFRRARQAADANGVALDDRTRAALAALGL